MSGPAPTIGDGEADIGDLTAVAEPDSTDAASVFTRAHGLMLVVLGSAGLAAGFTLAVDKYRILADPTFQPSCNLNPVLSCGSVMKTDQAEVFGFPNPLIGLIAFSAVIVLGLLRVGRVPLPRWVLGGLAGGGVLGAVFVHWLAFQSIYRIGALCPWCMVVWTVTLPIALWAVLLFGRTMPAVASIARAVWSVRFLVLMLWYLVFVTAALVQFWDYWRTLL